MSRFASSAYPTGSPTRRCAATGRTLEVGEHCVSALVEGPDDEGKPRLRRADFAADAWNNGARPASPARVVGSWRTTIHAATTKPKPILDDEAMLDLLGQVEGGEPRRDAMRYVLALMLVRRRRLAPDPSAATPAGTLRLRARGSEADRALIIEVKEPTLDEATLGEVIAELEAMTGTGDGDAAP
jgi:hypothetical protein